MSRRQLHAIMLAVGAVLACEALFDLQLEWLNRSDLFFAGVLIMMLGMHGLWKRM